MITDVVTTGAWVRPPAVAGSFYPEDPEALRDAVTGHLRSASVPADLTPPEALIVPHAGYQYSGPTAGAAYRAVAGRAGQVRRVVVVGPAHRARLTGVGTSTATAWATPLGSVRTDFGAARALVAAGLAVEADGAHGPEHSVEVQLPFLQVVLGDVRVVPLVVGRAGTEIVTPAIDALWDPETLIVASSDLSHYLDDATARARDAATATAILEERIDDIGPYDACGCLPIRGLLAAARGRGWVPRRLDLSTSADTSGEPDRVVGYGAFAVGEPPPLGEEDRRWLSALARRAIEHELGTGDAYPMADADVPERVRPPGASFVTLEEGDRLLGCIGSLEPRRPLWQDVARNARAAAFDDPRFPPLTPRQLGTTKVEISVLSHLVEIPAHARHEVERAVRPGVDGVLLAAGDHRGTFLPAVWEKLPEPDRFVGQLVRKAGLPGEWPSHTRAWRYTTDEFTDPPSS
ncbi:MAG TPA: AmmeMemoRadiSam system protein B [Acidimicrobiales bacterium]|nr:AmmeMemoRadiSam system protein B [Acidimicrobiales bacterium]